MARVTIDEFFCKGCGLCTDVCPTGILELDPDVITAKGYHPAHCTDEDKCHLRDHVPRCGHYGGKVVSWLRKYS